MGTAFSPVSLHLADQRSEPQTSRLDHRPRKPVQGHAQETDQRQKRCARVTGGLTDLSDPRHQTTFGFFLPFFLGHCLLDGLQQCRLFRRSTRDLDAAALIGQPRLKLDNQKRAAGIQGVEFRHVQLQWFLPA